MTIKELKSILDNYPEEYIIKLALPIYKDYEEEALFLSSDVVCAQYDGYTDENKLFLTGRDLFV